MKKGTYITLVVFAVIISVVALIWLSRPVLYHNAGFKTAEAILGEMSIYPKKPTPRLSGVYDFYLQVPATAKIDPGDPYVVSDAFTIVFTNYPERYIVASEISN